MVTTNSNNNNNKTTDVPPEPAPPPPPLPTLRYSTGSVVCPGDRIGSIRQVAPGAGAYARGGHVYASLAGRLQVVWKLAATAKNQVNDNDNNNTETSPTAAPPVGRFFAIVELKGSAKMIASTHVLSVGQVVLARVQRISVNQAFLEILAMAKKQTSRQMRQDDNDDKTDDNDDNNSSIGSFSLFQKESLYEGTVRREDIRSGASEQVQIQESFLPGDLVLCRVLSLGDNRRYFLSTAEPDLGVLYACSAKSGKPMMPISWKEMQCVETGSKELRKCARPRDLSSSS